MRDGNSNAVQWDGRRHVAIFIRSLHLLDLDLLEDWPGLSEQTFSPRAIQQQLQQRVKGVEWALFRLFELYSPAEARDKLRPFFPPLTSLQSVNLRAALLRALTELKKNGVLPKEILLRKTMLDECKGERLEELLASFSMCVLRKVLGLNQSGSGPFSLAPASAPAPASEHAVRLPTRPDAQCVPLILAYRVSLQQMLAERQRVEKEANVRKAHLERRAQSLSHRKAHALEQTPAIKPLERGRIVGLFKDEWTGDSRWINAILYEGTQELDDETCQFNQLKSGDAGLLQDLNRRVRVQQERLARWRKLEDLLPSSPEHKSIPVQAKPRLTANGVSFKSHQSIAPRLDNRVGDKNSDGVKDDNLLAPFAAILQQLDSDLESPRPAPTSHKKTSSQAGPNSIEAPRSRPEQESGEETTPHQYAPVSEFSWLDESEGRSRDNKASLPLPAAHPTGQMLSFAERARRPQAPLFSSDDDPTGNAVPEASSPIVYVEEKESGSPSLPAEGRGTLLERTRQSIAAYNAKPRAKTKSAKNRTSKMFPTNPFETPERTRSDRLTVGGSVQGMPPTPSSSKESTPREQLFSDEAEPASVFKSRPKVAQSPIFHAVASNGHDDSLLARDDNLGYCQ